MKHGKKCRTGLATALILGATSSFLTSTTAQAAVTTSALDTPPTPTVQGTTPGSITVQWQSVPTAVQYKVLFRPVGQSLWWNTDWLPATTTSYTQPTSGLTAWEFALAYRDEDWNITSPGPSSGPITPGPVTNPSPPGQDSAITMLSAVSSDQFAVSAPSGPYIAARNMWNSTLDATHTADSGISALLPDGGVNARFTWSFPREEGRDGVHAYPEIQYGVGGAKQGTSDPSAELPAPVSRIRSLQTSAGDVAVSHAKGLANVSYDAWLAQPGQAIAHMPAAGVHTEIMIPTNPVNGYGIPNYPKNGADDMPVKDRTGLKAGAPQENWVERSIIDGVVYDILIDSNHQGSGQTWQVITLLRVEWPTQSAHSIAWKPILDHLTARGWITPDLTLTGVEYGVEPSGAINNDRSPEQPVSDDESGRNGTAGELTVRDYKITADIAP